MNWDFHSGPVAKTPHSQCRSGGQISIPGRGARSHMLQLKKKKKKTPRAETKRLKITGGATKTQCSQIN